MRWILLSLVLFCDYCESTHDSSTISQPHINMIKSGYISYIYYPDLKIPWNSARKECQSLGGDLAKIDPLEVKDDMVHMFKQKYDSNVFSIDYWTGIVNPVQNSFFWVTDCSNLTNTSSIQTSWDSNKLCYLILKENQYGVKKDCHEEHAFLCQIQSATCGFIPRLTGQVLPGTSDMSNCESQCNNNSFCWAAVKIAPDSCVQLALSGYGAGDFNITTKSCISVTVNYTQTKPQPLDNSDTPITQCGNLSTTSGSNMTIAPTPTVTASPALPVCNTSTVTVSASPASPVCDTSTVTEFDTSTVIVSASPASPVCDTSTVTEVDTSTVIVSASPASPVCDTSTVTEVDTSTVIVSVSPASPVCDTSTVTEVDTSTVIVNVASVVATSTFCDTMTVSVAATPLVLTVTTTAFFTTTTNVSTEQASKIAEEYVKNLTVDAKSTSSHIRTLTSATDKRTSSKFVGCIAVLFIVIPMAIIFISDIFKIVSDFRFGVRV